MGAHHPAGSSVNWTPPLNRADGFALCSAAEALLKGFLETELDVHAVFAPRSGAFASVLALARTESSESALARNGVEVIEAQSALRGLELAAQQAFRGRRAALLISNDELDSIVGALAELAKSPLPIDAAIVLVLEDNPFAMPATCPRRVCRRAGINALEAPDVSGLRDCCDGGLRLSRGGRRPAAIVVHVSLMRSGATLAMAPNRQVSRTDHAAWLRRRRAQRVAEATDPLQIVRRMEVNRLEHLPNPGEHEPYGFIAVGAVGTAVRHMIDELGLAGRVPLLRLVALDPLDAAVVERMLSRCNHVIVVEARPGSVAPRIVSIAQGMLAREDRIAQVWWDRMPPSAGDVEPLGINDGLRTSLLTRRVIRLLHEVRPGLRLEERLAQVPAALATIELPRRSHGIGAGAVRARLDDAIAAAARTLAGQGALDASVRPRALVGAREASPSDAVACTVEVWDRGRFVREVAALVGGIEFERSPRAVIVFQSDGDSLAECDRLARAAATTASEARMSIVDLDANDDIALQSALIAAAGRDGLTIIVARDGPPARHDLAVLDRTAAEVDRDGFLRHQRFVLPADNACEIRDPGLAAQVARGLLRGADPLKAEPRVERFRLPGAHGIALKVDLLYEQVEIVRTRPPAAIDALREPLRLAPPQPVHASNGIWRAHLAGFRGDAPGAAGQLLAEAGRAMGFRVEWTHLGAPLGGGRRAWSQVVLTQLEEPSPDAGEVAQREAASVTAQIPYGEADLVLGVDPVETIRALATDPQLRVASPTQTAIVANTGSLSDQIDPATIEAVGRLDEAVQGTTMPDRRFCVDLCAEVRGIFLTDRPIDLVLVGIAFQRGFIPVSIEALESAARRLELRGFARSFEAIQLGRMLGADGVDHAARRSVSSRAQSAENALRIARRVSADRQLGGRRDRTRGARLRNAVATALVRMGGLGETREGRAALRDFAVAMRRCEMWGGFEYAMRYAALIESLVEGPADDAGLELASLAILPLAEGFLIRDAWYVGALTTSLDQSHRIRATLGVRLARGDEIHRRYLHRVDLRIRSRRWVIEFRSSDWPDRLLRATLPFMPAGLRGTMGERERREALSALVRRAARGRSASVQWVAAMRALHSAAVDGTLASISADAINSMGPRDENAGG